MNTNTPQLRRVAEETAAGILLDASTIKMSMNAEPEEEGTTTTKKRKRSTVVKDSVTSVAGVYATAKTKKTRTQPINQQAISFEPGVQNKPRPMTLSLVNALNSAGPKAGDRLNTSPSETSTPPVHTLPETH